MKSPASRFAMPGLFCQLLSRVVDGEIVDLAHLVRIPFVRDHHGQRAIRLGAPLLAHENDLVRDGEFDAPSE